MAFDEGEFVILGCPESTTGQRWAEVALDALDNASRVRDDPSPVRLSSISGNVDDPLPVIVRALGYDEGSTVADILAGDAGTVVIRVVCTDGFSGGWRRLFVQFGSAYRLAQGGVRTRPVLAIVTGCTDFPPVESSVGTRVRALWNTVRWEEMRLLVESTLPMRENALVRTWRVAVYTGASNNDPAIAAMLCEQGPNSLRDTIDVTLSETVNVAKGGQVPIDVPFVADERWEVPSRVTRLWAEGQISGVTLERGTSVSLDRLTTKNATDYLYSVIWREQVAGLLPVVIDMGFSVNGALANAVGYSWLDSGPMDALSVDGRINLEPAEVMRRIKETPRLHVPSTIWRALGRLRAVRNDLSHMRLVDLSDVRAIWESYDQVRRRFLDGQAG